jgi:hypothetical protein
VSHCQGYGHVICRPHCIPVAQTLVAREPLAGAMPMLAHAVEYVITSQHTGLSGATDTRPVQTHTPISTELCTGKQSMEHFQPFHGHPPVIMGCNPRRPVEAPGAVDTGSSLQNPQYEPLTMLSPLSLPQMSEKTSETWEITNQDA